MNFCPPASSSDVGSASTGSGPNDGLPYEFVYQYHSTSPDDVAFYAFRLARRQAPRCQTTTQLQSQRHLYTALTAYSPLALQTDPDPSFPTVRADPESLWDPTFQSALSAPFPTTLSPSDLVDRATRPYDSHVLLRGHRLGVEITWPGMNERWGWLGRARENDCMKCELLPSCYSMAISVLRPVIFPSRGRQAQCLPKDPIGMSEITMCHSPNGSHTLHLLCRADGSAKVVNRRGISIQYQSSQNSSTHPQTIPRSNTSHLILHSYHLALGTCRLPPAEGKHHSLFLVISHDPKFVEQQRIIRIDRFCRAEILFSQVCR